MLCFMYLLPHLYLFQQVLLLSENLQTNLSELKKIIQGNFFPMFAQLQRNVTFPQQDTMK